MVLSFGPRRKIDPAVQATDYQTVVLQWLKKRGSMDLNVELKGLEKMVCCKGGADWDSMGKWHELFGGLFAASRTGRIDPTMLEVSLQQLDMKETLISRASRHTRLRRRQLQSSSRVVRNTESFMIAMRRSSVYSKK